MKRYLIFPIYIFLFLFLLLNGKQGYGQGCCPNPPFCATALTPPTIAISGGSIVQTRNVKVISESGRRIIDGINMLLNNTAGNYSYSANVAVVLIPPSESITHSGVSRIPVGIGFYRQDDLNGNISYMRLFWNDDTGDYTGYGFQQPCGVDPCSTNYLLGFPTNQLYLLKYPTNILKLSDVASISYANSFVEDTGANCSLCDPEACSLYNGAPPCCNFFCYNDISDDLPLRFNMKNGTSLIGYFRSPDQYKERKYLTWKKGGVGTFVKKVAFNGSQTLTLAVNSPLANHTYQWNKPDGTTVAGTSISVTQAGFYSVTVTNSSGCKATSTEIIEVVQQFDIYPEITHVNHKNACAQATIPANQDLGSIKLTVIGQLGHTYKFEWSDPAIPTSTGNAGVYLANNLSEGTYTVTITNEQSNISRTVSYTIGKRVSWASLGINPPNRSFSDGDWIEKVFTVAPNNSNIHFGWSKTATTDNSTNIAGLNFAFSMQGTTLRIVESGNIINVSNVPTLRMNDVLRIKRENNQVNYYHNGNLLYTSGATLQAGEQLFLTRAAANTAHTVITDIGVSFAPACADEQYNFIRTQVFQVPVQEGDKISCAAPSQILTTTQYFDGLGRPIQSVAHNASPAGKDIIQPIVYDAFGRQVNSYLPYTETASDICARYRTDALTKQADFYNGTLVGVPAESKPYAVTDFEASPLNRVLRQFGAGEAWQGQVGTPWNINATNPASTDKSVKTRQRTTSGGFTRKFIYDKSSQTWSGEATYAKGELLITEVWDEDNKIVEEHKDLEGRIVLKKGKLGNVDVNTYYLYDELGRLVYVIQPEGIKALASSPAPNQYKFTDIEAATQINANIRDKFMFQYRYDARNRLIRKFVPGAEPSTNADWKGWTFMVYDKRDRVILTQEPRQRTSLTNGTWISTKYDALNRPVLVTEINLTGSQATLQNNANTSNLALFEVKDHNQGDWFYTRNLSYPALTSGNTISLNYYDSYDINGDNIFTNDIDVNLDGTLNDNPYPVSPNDLIDPAHSPYAKIGGTVSLYANRGKLVATRNRKITSDVNGTISYPGSPTFLLSVSFYDKYGRLVQSQVDNIKASSNNGSGRNKEITTIRYDFAGKVLASRHRHRATSPTAHTAIINKEMQYDHAGRLKRLYNQVDGQAKVLMAQNDYNEIGQLVNKKIHSLDEGNAFMQNVTYDYNIRGWLTFINKSPTANNISTATNSQSLFRMELRYFNNYNGNISTMLWRGNKAPEAGKPYNGNVVRQYAFTYDGLNRLTRANYTVGTGGLAGENYSVNNGTAANGISYDDNGNILNLQQRGPTAFDANQVPTAFGVIDDLTYAYSGNRLMRVTDAGDNTANTPANNRGDFKDGVNTGDDYTYDHSGNLTADLNKGITLITYNHLNLPMLIKKDANNYITYLYDGSGAKLKKTVMEAGVTTTTEYIGSFVYTNTGSTTDYFMATEEGRIVSPLSTGGVGAVFGSPETYEYTYKDHLGNARLSYRQQLPVSSETIIMTAEKTPASIRTAENLKFDNIAQAEDTQHGYRSSVSVKLNKHSLKVGNLHSTNKSLTANTNSSVRVSVRATWDTPPPIVQYMIVENGGTVQDQDKREKPVLPPNRLTLNSPIVVIPAQAQQNIGEVIIPPSPPRLNLIGVAQVLGKTLSLQRKAKEDPATPYQGDLGQMNLLGMQSTLTPPQAKLVVNLYHPVSGTLQGTYEQPVTLAGATAWEELSIGFTTTSQVKVEAYVISTEADETFYTWFDDLKIEIINKPTAVVVQENHYYPFGLGMKGLDYVAPSPNRENRFQYNGKEKQPELSLNWIDYGARNYDAQIGRWHSIDGMAEKYISFSPYHYCANNPIRNYDIDGNEFTESAERWIDKLSISISEEIKKSNKIMLRKLAKIEKAKSMYETGKISEAKMNRRIERKQKAINKQESRKEELLEAQSEISELRHSSQVYNVVESNRFTPKGYDEGAATVFNMSTQAVDIWVKPNGSLRLFAHELKHTHQFETGTTSLTVYPSANNGVLPILGWLAYDQQDETEAYKRQGLFGSTHHKLPTEYTQRYIHQIPREINSPKIYFPAQNSTMRPFTNSPHADLQRMANDNRQAFRINNTTYFPRQ